MEQFTNKKCGICLVEKTASRFQIRKKKRKDGTIYQWLRFECKDCQNESKKERYHLIPANKEKAISRSKSYSKKNVEKISEWNKDYREQNKEKLSAYRKSIYKDKSEEIREKRKQYYYKNQKKCIVSVNKYIADNKSKVREGQRKNHNKRKEIDFIYLIKRRLRGRVRMALTNDAKKAASTSKLVGCSIEFLKEYLQLKFTHGMDWDKFKKGDIHIDHKIPCALFDLSKEGEQFRCFHYTNLQPLWAVDNLQKGTKIL